MGRFIRIALLLLVLATVAQEAWLERSRATTWNDPLRVAVTPLNGDGSPATAAHIRSLQTETFAPIERFFDEESRRHGRDIHRAIRIGLLPELTTLPPPLPAPPIAAFDAAVWSLQLRWWAWRNSNGPKPNIRLYVKYFDPEQHFKLDHSAGLQRGMIGIVNAFASDRMAGSNNVVIAHEMMHTLGATDKYDPTTNLPRFPEGFGEPERSPRYPQVFAEIMGGRIPLSSTQAGIPETLDAVLVGPATAAEIGWTKP